MNNHDIITGLLTEKEMLSKVSSQQPELQELEGLLKQAEDPKVLALLMFRVVSERQRTNSLLESINDKYDSIMLSLKSGQQAIQQENNASQNRFEVLPEHDQAILKKIEEKGGCTAKDIKIMLGYKGLNAACQRLSRLFREGYLKKVQSGKKVLYLAKN
ncbi:Uncharacterised protein [uncultured archaeon]|nr:Uncharacterised protein [uncultured archaeon]